jgi:dihydrodipicolinate synthase/N-acetylneuraminate lyase
MTGETHGPLSGVVAATVTPLQDEGRELDVAAIPRLVDFYADAGASGVFVAGSTGEGLLLTVEERRILLESFLAAAGDGFSVVTQVGAQTTADAVALAEHARAAGATAVAAVGPPYYRYDDAELIEHFESIASACAPVPFYLYEIHDRTGYALSETVVLGVQQRAANLVGMKVSDRSLEELRAYLLPGLDVMVGSEPLIPEAIALGAVGAVSALAAALPRAVRRVLAGDAPGSHADQLRSELARYPFQSALKTALVAQGVLRDPSVRRPLRPLTVVESESLMAWLASVAIPGERASETYADSPAA